MRYLILTGLLIFGCGKKTDSESPAEVTQYGLAVFTESELPECKAGSPQILVYLIVKKQFTFCAGTWRPIEDDVNLDTSIDSIYTYHVNDLDNEKDLDDSTDSGVYITDVNMVLFKDNSIHMSVSGVRVTVQVPPFLRTIGTI